MLLDGDEKLSHSSIVEIEWRKSQSWNSTGHKLSPLETYAEKKLNGTEIHEKRAVHTRFLYM